MPAKWILSRTDRLGDLLLTLPLGNFLRRHLPEVEPVFLVSRYAAPLVDLHDPPFSRLVWEEAPSFVGYQAFVHVFPRKELAWRAWRARIPFRVGTARRWYHFLLCSHRPPISRRYSGKHETELNFRLLLPLLPPFLRQEVEELTWEALLSYRPRLVPRGPLPSGVRERIKGYTPLIVFHIGSGGGAPRWPILSWAVLANLLCRRFSTAGLVLTGSAGEMGLAKALRQSAPDLPWLDLTGQLTLEELVTLLVEVDLVIAGSTGPLHIAAAVGRPTLGLFPSGIATGPWRWRPLSPLSYVLGGEKLCLSCPAKGCTCLEKITPEEVGEKAEVLLRGVPSVLSG
ncbi:MAG: hypothetical protein N2170_03925 [Bacteroidia bacterium]|nr:hypothetical protein [Bacteroidia bacterium]